MIDEMLATPDVEVDIEYPEALHNVHIDYPLAPETISIQEEWLSHY